MTLLLTVVATRPVSFTGILDYTTERDTREHMYTPIVPPSLPTRMRARAEM